VAGFSREVSRRIFAEELRNSNLSFRDGEEQHQYVPSYLLTPTGAKCNRVFLVGTLTERDDIGGDTEYWRGRIVDPTGSILVYAGQYQPEAALKLASIEPPAYVAVVGKPNLYQTEDGNVIISLRAEAIQKVDEATRDRWIFDTAKRTLDRLEVLERSTPSLGEFSTADKSSISPSMDIDRAKMHYNTNIGQYRQMVVRALASMKPDLVHMTKSDRVDSLKSNVDQSKATEKPASKIDPNKSASNETKARGEVKAEATSKPKSKVSSPKEKPFSGFPGNEDSDEVETIPLFKKG
jgi:RPA family protein